MFETGVRQFRMAMGMVLGRRLDPRNIARLVEDALGTLAEFGEPGADVEHLLDGPPADAEALRQIATRGVQRTARRLAEKSPFYARRFTSASIEPAKLDLDGMRAVPVTVKADLIRQPADFQCVDVPRYLATRTTGTTGRPAEIWLSRYEVELWPAMGALSSVLRDALRPTDVMQVNVSSRATVTVHLDVGGCRLAGAGCRVQGIVPADEALDSLADGVTLLATVPSYLAELEVAARRRGMGPSDFRIRRIDIGGEVLSPSLARAARETFGVPDVNDLFGMTEIVPISRRTCDQGHLHYDNSLGLVEHLDLDTGEPAIPGALATIVITPYFPYRDCMPVFRYDTRDVVRMLPDGPLACDLAAQPATGPIVGKADHLLRFGPRDVVTPRQLTEAVEALPSRPWPARFGARADDGRVALTLAAGAIADIGEAAAIRHFAEHGLDVHLDTVADDVARALRPLRCDLRETTFVARPALIGA